MSGLEAKVDVKTLMKGKKDDETNETPEDKCSKKKKEGGGQRSQNSCQTRKEKIETDWRYISGLE